MSNDDTADTGGHDQADQGTDDTRQDNNGDAGQDRDTRQAGADSRNSDDGSSDLEARLAAVVADRDKWKAQARKHEGRARDNAAAATQAQTLEQQIQEMRQALADRDVRDVERNQRLAMTRVEARIAEAGVKPGDVADLLALVDPLRLLADGEPDDDAIAKVASSIARTGGRPAPDSDQGKGNGAVPANMNDLIRRAAGISR
jgi:hypothetical protein